MGGVEDTVGGVEDAVGGVTKDSFVARLSHFEQTIASFLLFFTLISSDASILLNSQREVCFGKASFLDRT